MSYKYTYTHPVSCMYTYVHETATSPEGLEAYYFRRTE